MSNLEQTLSIIKPDAVERNLAEEIKNEFKKNGFEIKNEKKIQLAKADAEQFYKVHETKPFYKDLCEYLSSGPVVVMILEKDNAIAVSLNNVPEIPLIKIKGKNTAIRIKVVAIIANVICLEPLYAATNGVSPFSIRV